VSEPLTDEELDAIDERLSRAPITNLGGPDSEGRYPFADPIAGDVQRLVAEVRRLRKEDNALRIEQGKNAGKLQEYIAMWKQLSSDEWLERAAEEIGKAISAFPIDGGDGAEVEIEADGQVGPAAVLAILRKYRDGA
jgi:hypothetical protein